MSLATKTGSEVVSKGKLTLCVVGSGGVGKSSLIIRYLHGHFPEVFHVIQQTIYLLQFVHIRFMILLWVRDL